MKRVLVALLAISMAAGVLTGCGSKGSDKTFTVGFDAEFPPYGYRDDNGEYVGFDLDLAAEVCKRQGWELVKQPIDWDAKDMELSSGAIDCIWNGFTMNGREDAYTWTEPYVDNSQVFVVAAASGVQNKEELAGKVVAVQKDSSALAALNDEENTDNIALRDSFAQLIEYADYNTAFMDLEQGAVDAVAIDIGVAQYQIAQREAGKFVMLQGEDNKLAVEQYAVGFLKGNDELRNTVQKTLDEMAADGTFTQIAEKWVLTLLFSLPLGLIVAFGRMSGCKVIRIISKIYISIMRGTPLMLQIIVVYFAPFYVFRMHVGTGYRFPAVIVAFVINYAAYFAEIYRAGIESIPVGQYEAAQVLGYSKAQTFVKIILPQVVKRVLPPVTNETITLVKDTSMAFTISIAEMFTVAKQIGAAQTSVVPLLAAGVFYYIFNLVVASFMEYLEKKTSYYR